MKRRTARVYIESRSMRSIRRALSALRWMTYTAIAVGVMAFLWLGVAPRLVNVAREARACDGGLSDTWRRPGLVRPYLFWSLSGRATRRATRATPIGGLGARPDAAGSRGLAGYSCPRPRLVLTGSKAGRASSSGTLTGDATRSGADR